MPAGLLHEEKEELMNKKKQSINYLDLIPQRAETLRWHTDEATGLITLEVENTGVFLAIALEILRIPVMPFAIGLYLPIYLNTSIMIGGAVRWFMDSRKNVDAATKEEQTTSGTLFCAGMIAGEGLVGILLAIFAVFGISTALSIDLGNIGGVVLMIVMIACLLAFSMKKKKN